MKKVVTIILLIMLATVFLSAGYSYAQTDTSILTMQGATWNLKIDSQLQTALESKNQPYVSVAKAGAEKELFLTLNSLADCKAGQIEFKVQTQGLSVYKQLPLDKELNVTEYDFVNATVAMKKDTVIISRPENVVNSFACFDSQGKKVMHIYGSKLIDAKGNSVWVDSDLKDGLLTVYLDQKFLGSAVFPVLVDPTFGYTNVGASDTYASDGKTTACKFSLTENADITKLSFYGGTDTGTTTANMGIYDSSKNLVFSATENTGVDSTAKWWNFTVSQTLSVGDYYIAVGATSYYCLIKYDSGDSGQTLRDSTGYMPATLAGYSAQDYVISVFATYTVSGGATPTPTPSPAPTAIPTVTNNIFAGIAILMFMIIIGFVLSLKPYSIINIVYGVLVLSVTAGLLLGGYLAGLWFFAFAGVAVGLICLLRGTDLL